MLDLLVKNARLAKRDGAFDIGVQNEKIIAVERHLEAQAVKTVDAQNSFVTPPFVDAHFHLDSVLSHGKPRINRSGTLLEGIEIWGELKPTQGIEDFYNRAMDFCRWSIARGTLSLRSHVDITDPRLLAVEALLAVREQMRPHMDIQLVAFPQDGFLRNRQARDNLLRALAMGVDVVGGIPHFERTMDEGAKSVRQLCEIAAGKGLMVDMHCDESDDPLSRHVETLCAQSVRLGLQGRVAGSHLTSMHSMDNYYVSKLLPLMAEAKMHVIANPLINITLQGRHDSYPKRRGMTRIKEQLEAGINVAFGHDCVMDPWYSLGSHDMLEVAAMGLHVGQMTSQEQMRSCFDAVTINGAAVMGLENYGIAPGKHADMVVLDCASAFDAIRLRPARLFVIRRGRIIATTARAHPQVKLDDKTVAVDFYIKDFR